MDKQPYPLYNLHKETVLRSQFDHKEDTDMNKISRRGFLKGVAASAIGMGVMGASALAEEKDGI